MDDAASGGAGRPGRLRQVDSDHLCPRQHRRLAKGDIIMSSWDRLESMARSIGLEGGLEARIADPLWMLARQWQVSEFRGDDAAQPTAVRITGDNLLLTVFKGGS